MIIRAAILALLLLTVPAAAQEGLTVRELHAIMNERDKANAQRFGDQSKAVDAALAAAEKAVLKAENAADKRFESVNEFRKTLSDQTSTFATKAEADIRFKGLEEKINAVVAYQLKTQGSSEGTTWLWAAVIAACGLMVSSGLLVIALRKKEAPRA
jgi:hypothetical protein